MYGPQGIVTYTGGQRNPVQRPQSRTKLTSASIAKAGAVILGTTATYYLAKATGILSYLRWGAAGDTSNSEAKSDHGITAYHGNSLAIMENGLQMIDHSSRLTTSQDGLNGESKEGAIQVEELEVKEIRSGANVRRSHSVVTPISDQNVTVGQPFSLTINAIEVFGSSDLVLSTVNLPPGLGQDLITPIYKGSYDAGTGVAYGVTAFGNYAYVAYGSAGLRILDVSDAMNPTYVGSYDTPSSSYMIDVAGNYTYLADNFSGLQIIDTSDPANPVFKGSYDTPGRATGVAVSGNHAYVADYGSGLQIINVSDPANPTFEGSYSTPDTALGVAVDENYAYVADWSSGLQIINITDPANPTFVGSYNTPGIAKGVSVAAGYAYVADESFGLQVIDISDPANPVLASSYNTPGVSDIVQVSGNYVYVADRDSGIQIIDIGDVTSPRLRGSYDTPCSAEGVRFYGRYIYVADGTCDELIIIDPKMDQLIISGTPTVVGPFNVTITASNGNDTVTDTFTINVLSLPNNAPTVANSIQDQTGIIGVPFSYTFPSNTFNDTDGHTLSYTSELAGGSPLPGWLTFDGGQREFSGIPTATGTLALNVTADDSYGGTVSDVFTLSIDPLSVVNPIPDQNVTVGQPFNIEINGTDVFGISGLSLNATGVPSWLSAMTNPTGNPTFVGSYDTPDLALKLTVSGNYAYVADHLSGLQIIDISNPASPTFKGSYNTPDAAYEVTVSGNYAYVADWTLGLQIIDISNPTSPTFKGAYNTPGWARGVRVSGNYAYVADSYFGLQIIDISNPTSPTFKGSYNTPDQAISVTVSGNYAYVADRDSGLQIIDISNPASPTFVGSYDTPDRARAITISGDYAYVADRFSGLQIIDISNPASPTFKGSYDTPDNAARVTVSGNYAYVADGNSGLQIIDISNPASPTFRASYNTPDSATWVTVSGNYAYVADWASGLQIIDISSVSNPNQFILSGTPTSVGTYDIDITGRNGNDTVTDTFSINVLNNAPIVANPIQNQTGYIGASFSYIFPSNTFSDVDGHLLSYTSELASGAALPGWLTFDGAQRQFSGTPTAVGAVSVKVTADDGYSETVSDYFDIDVLNRVPIVGAPIPNLEVAVNRAFSYTFPISAFSDPDGQTLTYTAAYLGDLLPKWLTFDADNRRFAGTATAIGSYSIDITANDGTDSVKTSFNIIVKGDVEPDVEPRSDNLVLWAAIGVVGAGTLASVGACIVFLISVAIYKKNNKTVANSIRPIELGEIEVDGGGQDRSRSVQTAVVQKTGNPVLQDIEDQKNDDDVVYYRGNFVDVEASRNEVSVPEILSDEVSGGMLEEPETSVVNVTQRINAELKSVATTDRPVETEREIEGESGSEWESYTDTSGESEPEVEVLKKPELEVEGESGSEWESYTDTSDEEGNR